MASSSKSSRRNWADMPIELLGLISDRLILLPDFIRFGAVCKPWNSAKQACNNSRICLYQEPPMLLAPANNNTKGYIYNIWEKKSYPNNLQIPRRMRYCGSGYGWLAFIEENDVNYRTLSVTLLNPFSDTTIHLPTIMEIQNNMKHGDPEFHLEKVILSCDPCLYPDDWVVVVILSFRGDHANKLSFIRSGEDSWKQPRLDDYFRVKDACFYQGKIMYMINDMHNRLGHIDLSQKDDRGLTQGGIYYDTSVTVMKINNSPFNMFGSYLVEIEKDLVLVCRLIFLDERFLRTQGFRIWKKLSDSADWIITNDLGKFSLFLGDKDYVAVYDSPNVPNFKPNCIYYTDQYEKSDFSIYDLATKQISIMHHNSNPSVEYFPLSLGLWISSTLSRK